MRRYRLKIGHKCNTVTLRVSKVTKSASTHSKNVNYEKVLLGSSVSPRIALSYAVHAT